MVYMCSIMAISTRESGSSASARATVRTSSRMVIATWASISRVSLRASDSTNGKMAVVTQVNS